MNILSTTSDGSEPITLGWLQSVGFDRNGWMVIEDEEITTTIIAINGGPCGWKVLLAQSGDDEAGPEQQVLIPRHFRTRDDLRELWKAVSRNYDREKAESSNG